MCHLLEGLAQSRVFKKSLYLTIFSGNKKNFINNFLKVFLKVKKKFILTVILESQDLNKKI